MRDTTLVCTLGPASNDESTIRDLAAAGMEIARINTSHGTPEQYASIIQRVRSVEATLDRPLGVVLDLQGPEIRTAPLSEPITLVEGATVQFRAGDTVTPEEIGISSPIVDADVGAEIYLDDGRIEAVIERVDAETVAARITSGGELGGRKSVVAPEVEFDVDVVTSTDRAAIEVGIEHGVDFVAASFVRNATDVMAVAEAIESRGADIPIVSKIERGEAVDSIDDIIDVSYGVMVARGDLGVECPIEDVPMIQKRLVRRCQAAGVPVIIATEMLDSMISSTRPTRAEASDVANAVLDGADAVMLSGETAVGEQPVAVVETMDQIVTTAEASGEAGTRREQRVPAANGASTDALARSARYLARDAGASAIVVASESGYTARKTAKYRPEVPIVASAPDERVRRQLLLSHGILPRATEYTTGGAQAIIEGAVETALETPVVESGDTVVVLSGMMTDLPGTDATNLLKLHVASEVLTTGQCVVAGRVAGPVVRTTDGELTDIPDGAIIAVPDSFDAEFTGDLSQVGGIVAERRGMTGYPAIVARELDVPMVSGVAVDALTGASTVTLDAERGVVYKGVIREYGDEPRDE
ncbi:pyruvate kinase [Halocatena salina]|uniref:Pyruvate kinase n=1 Tax=Halocatena salina TaxID=2934340 RepID=A0A8T9ZZ01_9EURY|nr:pyruvate kinase [Halocatena salina]UPM41981.1 pyruvate kinase [Halocatena salina]